MRLHADEGSAEERLSDLEIAELRLRLGIDEDRRAHGLPTVSDFSEACGLPTQDVQAELDRIRAEKALTKQPPRKGSQLWMLGLAVAMFATAWQIYRIRTPKSIDEQLDDEMAQVKEAAKHRPKRIHYPVKQEVDLGVMPRGFTVKVVGPYTEIDVKSTSVSLGDQKAATDQLAQIIQSAISHEQELERSTPPPDHPVKPDSNSGVPQFLGGPQNQTYVVINWNAQALGPNVSAQGLAEGVVRGAWQSQELMLGIRPPGYPVNDPNPFEQTGQVQPPPGFGVTLKTPLKSGPGYSQHMFQTNDLFLVPLDPSAVGRVMKRAVRNALDQEAGKYPQLYQPMPNRAIPTLPFTDVEIRGPLGTFTRRVPTAPSPEHRNAAEVFADSNKAIDQIAKDAEEQATRLNGGEQPKQ